MAPCVAIQKGCNMLPNKCFFVKYVKDYRCFTDLLGKSQSLLVTWSALVYTASKQVRRAFL